MTQEEKAKAYDEALKVLHKYDGANIMFSQSLKEEMFPELKESNNIDVKTEIKNIIAYFYGSTDLFIHLHSKEELLAWVEKQGEQKPADKVEPKFHEGEWVVFKGNHGSVYQIEKIEKSNYTLRHISGCLLPLSFSGENMLRLWTIEDAKEGDVLCYKDEISFYKHNIKNCTKQETTFGGFVYHCCYDGKRFITDSLYSLTEQDKTDIHPATKEQCDLLFKKMHEAGYKWDAEKKELRKIEQSPVFNVGDTIAKKHDFGSFTITDITGGKYWYNDRIICDITKQDEWELVEQNPVWSEEDENMLRRAIIAIDCLWYKTGDNRQYYKNISDWLNSLKDRHTWKPSKEQMQALSNAGNSFRPFEKGHKVLWSLYNDLKKLTEK